MGQSLLEWSSVIARSHEDGCKSEECQSYNSMSIGVLTGLTWATGGRTNFRDKGGVVIERSS